MKNLKLLAPLAIVVIVIVFVLNIYTHGRIPHPGKTLYEAKCAQCHGDNGEGIKSLVPPLTDAKFAAANFDSIPCWLKHGLNHPITVNGVVYDQPMYASGIDEIQAANVINYLAQEFWKTDSAVSARWVKERWGTCE